MKASECRKAEYDIGSLVDNLILEIKENIDDLKKHRISKRNLRKVVWKSKKGKNVTATNRVSYIIEDFLKLQSLVKDTTLDSCKDLKEIRKKVHDVLIELGFWEELKNSQKNKKELK